ncbi:MAG TPA: type II secretion system F family protein [Phycisphaerae bacterium]
MPWFEYEALTPGASLIAGRIEAPDHDRAMQDLAALGVEVRTLVPAERPPRPVSKLSGEDLIFFNEQLASLAQAGIALDEGLAQLARDVESPRLRRWINGLVEDIRQGKSLDQAVAAREQHLPILYSNTLRAGMESGQLSATLLNLNQHLRLAGNTRRIIWETAAYPILVGIVALTVVSVFFGFVVPQFKDIFLDFNTQLPVMTQMLLDIADHYVQILAALITLILMLMLIWRLLRAGAHGRALRESIVLNVPVVGPVYRSSLLARFLHSVASAVASGIALPRAIRLGSSATGSGLLTSDAEHLASEVERGESIFAANQSTRLIPSLFGFCVQTALGRDALPSALGKLARAYEERAAYAQGRLRAVLFPVFILVLGGLVGTGIVGLFLPLIALINSVSSQNG